MPGATGYKIAPNLYFSNAFDVGTATTTTETGLSCNTSYTRYVWAYSGGCASLPATLTQTTSACNVVPVVTTSPVSAVTQYTVLSGGNVTCGNGAVVTSRGVCWSTTENPTIAAQHTVDGSGLGTFTSTVTGLQAGTGYYIRAYATSIAGTAYGNEIGFTTLPALNCGTSSLTITHTAGAVAPVNKTTTYNTVTNVPGETSKCWIASNLGSDHQASAVNDATEASAGWYWQFNQKQGFKHDGTIRTPNTQWNSSINENSDWVAANDPCSIELGASWRIPTGTELNNVYTAGGWTNWNGPWGSPLKLHAGGDLLGGNGTLLSRGGGGSFWSSTQNNNTDAFRLYFNSSQCVWSAPYKTYGLSLRCLNSSWCAPPAPAQGAHTPSENQIIWN